MFTSDVSGAVQAIREIDAGMIHINWTPLWRADLMPYGGLKGSGIGKEGPRSAVAEMTDVEDRHPARPALVDSSCSSAISDPATCAGRRTDSFVPTVPVRKEPSMTMCTATAPSD